MFVKRHAFYINTVYIICIYIETWRFCVLLEEFIMAQFGKKSRSRLETAHIDLQTLFNEVIKNYDCSILEGYRSIERQKALFDAGKSKIDGIHKRGKHNLTPSHAVDVVPWPISWTDTKRFYYFAGYVLAISDMLLKNGEIAHQVRWGGNWAGKNTRRDLNRQKFNDLVHFELLDV